MNREIISRNLIALRGKRKQIEVASAIGVAQSTYCAYENGDRLPSDEVKTRISAFYGVPVQDIFFNPEVTLSELGVVE